MRSVSAVLVHHPILDRQRAVVTGAITNLDLHDISRSAHTYGLSAFYVAHPIGAQRELATRVREHWISGSGARRIPDRVPPMRDLRVVTSLDEALESCGADDIANARFTGLRSEAEPHFLRTRARRAQ